MYKGKVFLILLLTAVFYPIYTLDLEDIKYSGPLYGKNYYLPHLLIYSFPGFSPRTGEKGDITSSISYSGINEFLLYFKGEVRVDYESSVLESSFTYRVSDKLLIGTDIRLISYYGGFMDPVIDFWHDIFDFPGAGRSLYPSSDVDILIKNSSGNSPTLDGDSIYLGDTDIYGVWNIAEDIFYSVALAAAVKLPTGSFTYLTGSNYMDLGLQALGELYLGNRWVLGLQQGVVFPGEVILNRSDEDTYASNIVSQTFLWVEFSPYKDLGFITQFRVNTSPISSTSLTNSQMFGDYYLFTLPQTSLIIGVKKYYKDLLLQLSLEEDPFTLEGVDVQWSFRATKAF